MEFLPMGRAEAENCVRDIKHFTPDKIVFDVAIVRINNHGKKSFLAHQKRNSSLYEVLLQDQVYDWDESIQHAVTRKVKEHTSLNVTKIVGSVSPMYYWYDVRGNPYEKRCLRLGYVALIWGDGSDYTFDTHEYKRGLWVEKGECRCLPMIDSMLSFLSQVYMLPWWTVKERPNDGRYLEFRGRVWAFYGLPNHYLGGIRSDDSALDKEVEEEEFYR
ncbi:hypothetical protein FPOAC2_03618 [Fusarium poae]|uniref:Uncharacterized protein n=1 Tax=Fusarium poae TaxID=36050 RepID=A0A1B8B9J8_FUSPO|nr:hypothetical protein FPOA_03332 [Fusarium poae]